MTFEEFFKKKRIDLTALKKTAPALFVEFETHFVQMGEKSFDHTKKYWFNKLRRQHPIAPEIKTEKPHMANPLAEQTVTESLTETVTAAPVTKPGFTPKFRAGNMPKPPADAPDKIDTALTPGDKANNSNNSVEIAEPKPAYQPRFKIKPKTEANLDEPEMPNSAEEEKTVKPAYQPRFVPPKPKE